MSGTQLDLPSTPPPGSPDPDPSDRFAERRRRIERCPDPALREDALALCTFDRLTDPIELKSPRGNTPELADSISAFTQFLIHRTIARAAFALHGREFEPPPESQAILAHAVKAEGAFRSVLKLVFPPAAGTTTFPIRRFERVFARFVGGELRLGVISPLVGPDPLANHGVPDGANYFCFAEAVLFFVRHRLQAGFWTPLLPSFVGGAQFFAAAYWRRPRRDWSSYGSSPTPPIPAAVILAAIEHLYVGDTPQLARQFSEIVGIALRQEPTLPRPAFVPKELQ